MNQVNTLSLTNGWETKLLGDVATFSQGIQVGLEQHLNEPKDGYVRFLRIVDYTQHLIFSIKKINFINFV